MAACKKGALYPLIAYSLFPQLRIGSSYGHQKYRIKRKLVQVGIITFSDRIDRPVSDITAISFFYPERPLRDSIRPSRVVKL